MPIATSPLTLEFLGQSLEQGWDESVYPNATQPWYDGTHTPPTVTDPVYGTLTMAWDGVRWTALAPDGLQWVWEETFQRTLAIGKGLLNAIDLGGSLNFNVGILQSPYPVIGTTHTGSWGMFAGGMTRVNGMTVQVVAPT